MSQMVFRRVEMKYLLTRSQQDVLLKAISPYILPDAYAHSSIRNLYYDTPSFRLIRESLDKPIYKEKLRLRSYGRAGADSPVFAELKKKYDSIVYKRRLELPMAEALRGLDGTAPLPDSQIGREIQWALTYYRDLKPRVFLSYERDSFHAIDGSDIRITFDDRIHYRTEQLTLDSAPDGIALLPPELVLMELKLPQNMPLWLAEALSCQNIYKTTFSKYGAAYLNLCAGESKGDLQYA